MKLNEKSRFSAEVIQAYGFNTPLILMALIFIVIPVAGTIYLSFFRDVTFLPDKFLGVDNFRRLVSDLHFWQSIRFTLLFVAVSVFFELIIGLTFALVLNEAFPGRGFLRVAILIPWAIPIAVSARIWELIYNYEYGILNYLVIHLGFSDTAVNWLGSSTGAFFSLVLSDVWKTVPFMTIIFMAGLSTIPHSLYKQAMIDGTTFLQRFRHITLPLLRPALVVALLFRTIDAIRIFDLVFVLTGGGPGGSTTSISLYAYRYYLTGDFGYGSAISVVVFLMTAILALLYIKAGKFTREIQ
ncbi:MAG: sugar ABC transporter permease [Calditrichaeota bacterium]|nr:MAG: sugar ABC transporter permease [Calditrichota bacterium]